MKYLGNELNKTRLAALLASHLMPSNTIGRTDQADKAGGGDVELAGDFTGQTDQIVDIKIVDQSGTHGVTNPVFTGQGNGTLSGLAVSSSVTTGQTITITLIDAGTVTVAATVPFEGAHINARTPGSGGNDIILTVDRSGITLAPTAFSLTSDLQTGGNGNVGDQWNFGNALLDPVTLMIPTGAPRLSYGYDNQVYRAYKTYDGQIYTYKNSPDVIRAVPAGSSVWAVSGTYSITVTDGVTTETFPGLQTVFDALTALNTSSLVIVDGGVIQDTHANGMAIDDLSTSTGSFLQSLVAGGGLDVQHAVINLTVADGAPTELLTITCTSNAIFNAETWSVFGSVGGNYGSATTGVEFTADGCPYTFTIPLVNADGGETPPGATMLVELVLQPRSPGQQSPNMDPEHGCVVQPTLGVAAHDGIWEFTWQQRPVLPCDCASAPMAGGPSQECLGVQIGGGAVSATDLQRLRAIKLDRWFSHMTRFLRSQTVQGFLKYPSDSATDLGSLLTLPNNGALITGARNIAADALNKIFSATGSAIATRADATTYAPGSMVVSTNPAVPFVFITAAGGLTGTGEPAWPAVLGGTVGDNTVTWQAFSYTAAAAYDAAFAQMKLEIANMTLTNVQTFAISTAYKHGDYIVPASPNGHLYYVGSPDGTSGGSTPTYPTTGAHVTSGGIVLQDMGAYWSTATAVAEGTLIFTPGGAYEAVNAGTTHASTEPTWDSLYLVDNTVKWVRVGMPLLTDKTQMLNDGAAITYGQVAFSESQTVGGAAQSPAPTLSIPTFYGVAGSLSLSGSLDESPATNMSNSSSKNYGGINFQSFTSAGFLASLKSVFAEAFAIAGVNATFSGASTDGDGCWQDALDANWFAYDGTDVAYLPIQPGHYYHTTVKTIDSDGHVVIRSTKEWGFGPKICGVDLLIVGQDKIRVTVSGAGAGGGTGAGYQTGEGWTATIVNAAPLQLAGGAEGDNTEQWSVVGSAPQTFDPYALNIVTPNTYIDTATGMTMLITPGPLPFQAGDTFVFGVESARFEFQINGGGFSSATNVATGGVSIGSDGLVVNFLPGNSPSWVVDDQWTFKAEAVNGPDNLRTPKDGALAWHDDQTLVITPVATYGMTTLMLGDHTIPSTAVITLEGSNDNFATSPFNITIPWVRRNIKAEFVAQSYAKFRLKVNLAGSIQWLYLSDTPLELQLTQSPSSIKELGILTQKLRLPTIVARDAINMAAEHTCINEPSYLALSDLLVWAGQNDQGRFGVIPTPTEVSSGIFTSADPEVEYKDELDFQATDGATFRAVGVTLNLSAIA